MYSLDYSLFFKQNSHCFSAILVYVDDLILAGNSLATIEEAKSFFAGQFHMKDMGGLRYFLRIEVDQCSEVSFLSLKKYVMGLVDEYGFINCRRLRLRMDSHVKLYADNGDPLQQPDVYQKLMGKLIYLTITRQCLILPSLYMI